MSYVHGGMDRRHINVYFRSLGGLIVNISGTGEDLYSHPLLKDRVRVNARRKDAPRQLVVFVKNVERAVLARTPRKPAA